MTDQASRHEHPLPFESGCIHASVDVRTYRLVAVQKAAYKLASRCTIIIGTERELVLPITFTFSAGVSEDDARAVAQLFFRELLDQELREKIGEETAAVRALILAHAFSKTDLIERG
jgi:His-Xaa-Ser system protein HxsD